MTYNSELKDGSDLNTVKIPQSSKNDGLSVNPNFPVKHEGKDGSFDDNGLRASFDQVLSFFLKEVSVYKSDYRPLPPKLGGSGPEVDLFKLFLTVRRIGSYESVSENSMWEFVAKECGLEVGVLPSLKFIYIRYLKELDQWLIEGGFKDAKMESLEVNVVEKLELLSRQLEEYTSAESNCSVKPLIDVEFVGFEDGKKGKCVYNEGTSGIKKNEDEKKRELSPENVVKKVGISMVNDEVKRNELSPENVVKKVRLSVIHDDESVIKKMDLSTIKDSVDDKRIQSSIKSFFNEVTRFPSDNDVTLTANDDNADKVDCHNVEKVVRSKRKRGEEYMALLEMVDWVSNAAKNPHDIAYGASRRSSKWKKHTGDKLWKQVLLTRKSLFADINFDSGNEASGSQKKNQKMHPSMYEDDQINSRGKKCTRKTNSACSCPNCILRSSSRNKRQKTEPKTKNTTTEQTPEIIKPYDPNYKIGPDYQAIVPAWTGPVYDSDPKWLGTQMWAPQDDDNNENEYKGISVISQCECVFRGSVECVRFHIAENRLKLKLELGPLFYKWKFNQMGEEMSLSWEPEEEKRFKGIVVKARQDLLYSKKLRNEIVHKFWKKAFVMLPAKSKEKLVSYYWNVFVLRRRSYQNRVTPKDIDSDNDEEEVGSVGDRFGYEKIHGISLKCSENMQCTDLES